MTQFDHSMIATILTIITFQLFFKKFFYNEEEVKSWEEWFKKYL